MKKIILPLIFTFILISLASAASFDNLKSYDKDIKKITITNAFGLGGKIEELTLKSNTNTCGRYCYAEKEIVLYEEGKLIDSVKFETIGSDGSRKEEPIKNYKFSIGTIIKEKNVDDYKNQCQTLEGTNGTIVCDKIKTGSHREYEYSWTPYNFETKPAGNYLLKLEGEKSPTKTVDWIVTSQGREINEWAVWGLANTLINGSVLYYKLDDTTGTTLNSARPALNGTVSGTTRGATGKINSAFIFGDGSAIDTGFQLPANSNLTLSAWVNISDYAELHYLLMSDNGGYDFGVWTAAGTGKINYNNGGGTIDSNIVLPIGKMTLVTVTINNTGSALYFNDTLMYSGGGGQATASSNYRIGAHGGGFEEWIGLIDELGIWNRSITHTEVIELYNLNYGLSHPFISNSVTLLAPADGASSSTTKVSFNCSAQTDGSITITNISLWINASGTFERNLTNVVTGTSNTTEFFQNITQPTLWSCEACDSEDDCGFASENRTISLDSGPPTMNIISPNGTLNYGYAGENITLNYSISDSNLDTCWFNYNGTNRIVNCNANATFILTSQNSLTLYANDTLGNVREGITNWSYKIFENSRNHNTTSYETDTERYVINITSNSSLTAVNLVYNGTSYSATNLGSGLWSKTLSLASSTVGNNTIVWNFTYGSSIYTSRTSYQKVNGINLGLCNSTLNINYINFTFKDEASMSNMNATIPSATFIYHIGAGDANKTLNFINITSNPSYAFCFGPDNKTISVDVSLQYASTGYPQRIFDVQSLSLTNVTTNKVLYLLASADGLYVTFQVINSAEQPLEGVAVNATRSIGGENVLMGTGTTGATGTVTFWLNPDFQHTANFYLSPYPLYSVTQAFTNTEYTISLGSVSSAGSNDYFRGMSYSIQPSTAHLSNDTIYNFNFTVSSTYWSLEGYGFNITNEDGNLLGTATGTGATGGIASLNLDTASNETFRINYYWIINGSTVSASKSWIIIDLSGNSYSLARLMSDLSTYVGLGLFGLTDFGVGIIAFIIILTITGTIRVKYGISDESVLIGVLFSLVALFDISFGLIPNPIGAVPNFPTIFMGMVFAGFMFKEVFQ